MKYYIEWEAFVVYNDGHQESELPHDNITVDEDYISEFIENGEISDQNCMLLIDKLHHSGKFNITANTLISENSDYSDEDVKDCGINIISIESDRGDTLYRSDVYYT